MSLLREQSVFMLQVCELLKKASELGFQTAGGELYRTPEQQLLHVQNGRSQTMSSQHLKRLAIDLNFFKDTPDRGLQLSYDVDDLRPLGQFWESLDPANRWGGNWSNFKDAPHFERREGPDTDDAAASMSSTNTAAALGALPPLQRNIGRSIGLTSGAVGAQCSNQRDDVETVQLLLNLGAANGTFVIDNGALKPDGAYGQKTLTAIMAYQRTALGESAPSGRVEPASPTLVKLCEALPSDIDTTLLGLLYLRAATADVATFAERITQVMANRQIDSKLRQAHFLAQIGHESGEFRFRAEIASGEAYQGRVDLGNLQPGDGQRYKGRGLIQLTGRANYGEYGRAIGREAELLAHPELVETDPELCVDVAGWFWAKRGLNAFADADDLTTLTKRINGGLNGFDDRRRLLTRGKALLGLS